MSVFEKLKSSWWEICVSIDRWCKPIERRFNQCAILNILGHAGRPAAFVSIIIGVCVYAKGFDDRRMQAENQRKATHYQAWQIIKAAQGQRSSGGRVEALQDLNNDKVSLAGVDISNAYLIDLNLENANLTEAILTGAEFNGAILSNVNLTKANISHAGLARADLSNANLTKAECWHVDLNGADFTDANLTGASLQDANLTGANLTGANLHNIRHWQQIESIERANIYGVKNPPDGFREWALKQDAVEMKDEEWKKFRREKRQEQTKEKQ